jgi:putative molybdopterin biosynthesis protein
MKSLDEARRIVAESFGDYPGAGTEIVPAPEAVGRVLAEPVAARFCAPNFHAAAMDGIAVTAKHTFGAHETRPKVLHPGRDAFWVNTGQPMPPVTDAVIMIEQLQVLEEGGVRIEAPAFPWQHVRKMGEDIVATEMLFARRHVVTPYCIGALLAAGVFAVKVLRRPKVMLIPTGNELIDWRTLPAEGPQPGRVIESNSYVLAALIERFGGKIERHAMLGDDLEAIKRAVADAVAVDFDAVLILGGSSAGSEDHARAAIAELGTVLVHGVTMMPGKPAIVGRVENKAVFGIPGYPVSAIIAFEQLVQPLLARLQGRSEPRRATAEVVSTRKLPSKLGVEEFVRVKIGQVGDRLVATPLPRGAGSITTITEADGVLRIPAAVEGINENTAAVAELLRPRRAIRDTVVIVGSHDNALDLLADELRVQNSRLSLSSSHVGSLGGLMALKRGLCHMAGTHLLEESDGSYNLSYIRKYLPDTPVKLVHLAMREQGLILPKGNPKGIRGLEDLAREDVRLINRQGGSGTRILLDFRLKHLNIAPERITGYHNEEFTHMAVAVAVLSGAADAGMGIQAAANALGLDFIPIVTEQYDLAISAHAYDGEAIRAVLSVIASRGFKERVLALGGYQIERTGEVLL